MSIWYCNCGKIGGYTEAGKVITIRHEHTTKEKEGSLK